MTQHARIAAYLREHPEGLTTGEALEVLGVYALSQRVGELRRQGMPIEGEMEETAGGARVKRYRLRNALDSAASLG